MKSRIYFSFLFILLQMNFIQAQDYYYPPPFSDEWEVINDTDLSWCDDQKDELNSYLEETNTKAFIILKEGRIALESYFDEHEMNTLWYWASAGKSLNSVLTGIVMEEGNLELTDKTSDFLGEEWTSCENEYQELITVWHQLTMTSGLDFTVDNLDCTDSKCLECLYYPEEEWFYHNAPYTLLSSVLSEATGESMNALTGNRLLNMLGFFGIWTDVGYNRIFSSSARGMARFGLMMLGEGTWNGSKVVKDSSYFNAMISPSQDINPSYGYLWWLNGQESYRLPGTTLDFPGSLVPDAPDDLYAAIGKNGQICIVVPSMDLVLVRMGNASGEGLVPLNYVRELWKRYSALECTSSIIEPEELDISIHPRLTDSHIEIESSTDIDFVEILNRVGQLMIISEKETVIDVSHLKPGFYFARVNTSRGIVTKRFAKL